MTALTPEQMRALEVDAFAALQEAIDTGRIRMTVPAQPERDTDLRIASALAALRAAADQLEAVRTALDESIPPYNSELRPDGSEDPVMAAYVEGVKDVYLPLDAILTADTAPQDVHRERPGGYCETHGIRHQEDRDD